MEQKIIFIVHGWGGGPEGAWIPWLKLELERQGYEVFAPEMPDTESPKIDEWIGELSRAVKSLDKNTFFVGHSIGCQAILRYLETLSDEVRVGGAVFVAGWMTLRGLESEEEKEIAKSWLEKTIDFKKVKRHCNQFVALFSDDDPFVSLENKKFFEENLNAEIAVEHNMGHFDGEKVPVILESTLKLID